MKKQKSEIIHNYSETRMVLTEKAPFGVFLIHEEGDYDYEPYLVRRCTSLKELMSAFKKGLDWEEKVKFNNRYLNPESNKYKKLIPEEFYIIVKGFNKRECGKALRIRHTIKANKIK
jgi:hypothetical protein